MIQSFFRNSLNFGLYSTLLLSGMAVMATLMGLIVVLFSFPAAGVWIADQVGHGRFVELIQLLY